MNSNTSMLIFLKNFLKNKVSKLDRIYTSDSRPKIKNVLYNMLRRVKKKGLVGGENFILFLALVVHSNNQFDFAVVIKGANNHIKF